MISERGPVGSVFLRYARRSQIPIRAPTPPPPTRRAGELTSLSHLEVARHVPVALSVVVPVGGLGPCHAQAALRLDFDSSRLAEMVRLCERRDPPAATPTSKAGAWRRLAQLSRREARMQRRISAGHADRRTTRPRRASAKVRLREPTVEVIGEVAGSSVAARGGLADHLGRAFVLRARRNGTVRPRGARGEWSSLARGSEILRVRN